MCKRTCSELVGVVWEMPSAGADILFFSVGSCVWVMVMRDDEGRKVVKEEEEEGRKERTKARSLGRRLREMSRAVRTQHGKRWIKIFRGEGG